eukprot:gnl/Dysnectes_brevis/4496_a6063_1065.p1 GENE.gnl/Dysnectes_brevis/4496_a6063_1065~~gnl/Dysnectes_brevis/4496_a6063_1065.p1  ORF type:complete len:214 (+),score=23.72 gnl/Dysnectes_brevis/4496_a6063_1065:47-643(+)
MDHKEIKAKLVFLGAASVGKTCIISRKIFSSYEPSSAPSVGGTFFRKTFLCAGREVNVNIWDTAGQERFQALTKVYFRSTSIAVVVFDCMDHKSFERANFWVEEVRANEPSCAIVLAANKWDLVTEENESRVSDTEIDALAALYGAESFKVSAKTGLNIDELFQSGVDLWFRSKHQHAKKDGVRLNMDGEFEEKECGC